MRQGFLPSVFVWIACSYLVGCGGSSNGTNQTPSSEELQWQAGVFPDSDLFKSRCASPRSSGDFDDESGSSMHEKMWLRSWSDEIYLWYNEIPDQDPSPFTVFDYFDELVTAAVTPSGAPRDQFHFTFDTEEWIQLSQSGVSSGYGMQLAIDNDSPRSVTIVYTEPGTPAANANLARGTRILEVNGTSITVNSSAEVSALNAGLFPDGEGETHQFVVLDEGATSSREVTLVSAVVTSTPVQNIRSFDIAGETVGYMLFNDHIATAEAALVSAIEELSNIRVSELVLDLRYNGGGFLTIASQLAYMIAGPEQTADKVFELQQFNDKHPTVNPITGQRIEPNGFESQTRGFSLASGQALPSLNLNRVYVLTGSGTCSASEAIINGLRGIGVEVVQIGATTCGKPYGFYPIDNCGTTYFTIQFRGVNDVNFGDFSDGFSPSESSPANEAQLPGCLVADDLSRALGDPEEARLATALRYIETGVCSQSIVPKTQFEKIGSATKLPELKLLGRPPWRTNRLLGAPSD